jgi:hypothetical protein
LVTLETSIQEGKLFFEPLSEKIKLKEVILGCRSCQEIGDVKKSVCGTGVEVIRARPAFREFHMTPQKNRKLQ